MNKTRIWIFAGLLALPCGPRARCQEEPNVERGASRPYASYQSGNIDNVNLSNGGLVLNGKLWTVPQRGGMDLEYSFLYSSKSLFLDQACDETTGACWQFWSSGKLDVSVADSRAAS